MILCRPTLFFKSEATAISQQLWQYSSFKGTNTFRKRCLSQSKISTKSKSLWREIFSNSWSNDGRKNNYNYWMVFTFMAPGTINCLSQVTSDDVLYHGDNLQKGPSHIPPMQSSIAREYFALAVVERGFKKIWHIILGCVQIVSSAWRTIQLFFLFLPNLSTLPIQYLIATRYKTSEILDNEENNFQNNSEIGILSRLTWFERIWYQTLLTAIEYAGPTFIKLGQWASTRPDVFSKGLAIILSKLHDRVSHHSFETTKRTVENAFGRPLDSVFESFEANSTGSGCIAQVHRAQIKVTKTHAKLTPGEDHRDLIQQVAVKGQ